MFYVLIILFWYNLFVGNEFDDIISCLSCFSDPTPLNAKLGQCGSLPLPCCLFLFLFLSAATAGCLSFVSLSVKTTSTSALSSASRYVRLWLFNTCINSVPKTDEYNSYNTVATVLPTHEPAGVMFHLTLATLPRPHMKTPNTHRTHRTAIVLVVLVPSRFSFLCLFRLNWIGLDWIDCIQG